MNRVMSTKKRYLWIELWALRRDRILCTKRDICDRVMSTKKRYLWIELWALRRDICE